MGGKGGGWEGEKVEGERERRWKDGREKMDEEGRI